MLNSYSSTRNYPYYKLIVLFADLLVVNSLYWALYALSDCLSWHILDLTDPHYWIADNPLKSSKYLYFLYHLL